MAERSRWAEAHPSFRHIWWVPIGLFAVTAAIWVVMAAGHVALSYVGDEAARLLISYGFSTPGDLAGFLADRDAWLTIHPPGDFAFKAVVNQVAGVVVDGSAEFVRLHKAIAALAVIGGLALAGVGLATGLSRLAAAVFLALAAASAPLVYTAHHAVAEGPAVLLVGLAALIVLREPWDRRLGVLVAASPLALAGLFRVEAALVFSTLAVIPLVRGRWRAAFLFGIVAAGPTLLLTLATELLTGEVTYASVRPFAGRDLWKLLIDARLARFLWGLGILPWFGVALAAALAVVVFRYRRRRWKAGLALAVGWAGWCLGFVWLITLGVIPQQERVFVFPALLGALAVAWLADAAVVREGGRSAVLAAVAVAIAVTALLTWRGLIELPRTYDAWDRRVPVEAAEVNAFLARQHAPDDTVLLDWMWWWEWPAGVYAATPPDDDVCNYLVCPVTGAGEPPGEVLTGLSPIEVERLSRAWEFTASRSPAYIVMLTDAVYADWLAYQRSNPEELSSFARPLLAADGDCFVTTAGLPAARYCPALANDRYLVLARQ